MASKFKAGDPVQLTVGGPVMVVDDVPSEKRYWCTWFAGKKRERAIFSEATLKAATVDDEK